MSDSDSELSIDCVITTNILDSPVPSSYISIDDHHDEPIKLNEDIYHVFILHLLNVSKPNRNTLILGITSVVVFFIQFLCLFGFSYIYFHNIATKEILHTNQLTAAANHQLYYRLNGTNAQVNGDIFIDINVPSITTVNFGHIQYWSVIIVLLIISCYLFQTAQTFISTLSIFVSCGTIKNSPYRLLLNCIISLNLGLIFNVWIFSVSIMWYGFETTSTSDLFMIPVVIIFILQIDDWAYKWFYPTFISDSIQSGYNTVTYVGYSDMAIKYSLCSIVMCLSWILSIDLCYDMFWEEQVELFILVSYGITFLVSVICPLINNYSQKFEAFMTLPFMPTSFILTAICSWIILNEMSEVDYRGDAWIILIVASCIALLGLGLCILSVILKEKVDVSAEAMYIMVPLISLISAITITCSLDTKSQFQYDDEIYGWFLIFLAILLSPITMALYIANYVNTNPYAKLIGICVLLLLLFVSYNIYIQLNELLLS